MTDHPAPTAAARPLDHLGLVGGGTMGRGIAAAALMAGLRVTLVTRSAASATRAAEAVAQILDGAVARGKLDAARRAAMTLAAGDDPGALATANLVIESVPEDLETKLAVFRRLDAICRPGAVLATNTSYLDVNRIAAATARPGDVLGLHFCSPAHIMRLVEVVVARQTAPEVAATGFALAARLGKIGVRSGVCEGFIGNRIMQRYRSAADHMVLDGVSPFEIDAALTRFGFAMGPYAISDLAGLDIGYATRRRLAPTRHPRERVPAFADRLVEAGRLGRKTGRGFYLYDDASPQGRPDPDFARIAADLGIRPRPLPEAEIVARYLAAMVNEGAAALEDGIARTPGDIDLVLCHGYGFPKAEGGPMAWADRTGLDRVAARITDLARQDDHFWRLSPLLARLAASGGRFADLAPE